MIRLLMTAIVFLLFCNACIKPSKLSDVPQISFNKITFDTISLISGDSTRMFSIAQLGYQIKNGELNAKKSTVGSIAFTDKSGGLSNFSLPLPSFIGNQKYDAEQGSMEILIQKDFIITNSFLPFVTIFWDVQLTDKFGNKSNVIQVGPITVLQ
jgi:hypothetical protein